MTEQPRVGRAVMEHDWESLPVAPFLEAEGPTVLQPDIGHAGDDTLRMLRTRQHGRGGAEGLPSAYTRSFRAQLRKATVSKVNTLADAKMRPSGRRHSSPTTSGRLGSAAHSAMEPSYTATSRWPRR